MLINRRPHIIPPELLQKVAVESGVPVPREKLKYNTDKSLKPKPTERSWYDFSGIEIGSSIFFQDVVQSRKTMAALRTHGCRRGWSLVSKKVDGGVRIWRVK